MVLILKIRKKIKSHGLDFKNPEKIKSHGLDFKNPEKIKSHGAWVASSPFKKLDVSDPLGRLSYFTQTSLLFGDLTHHP